MNKFRRNSTCPIDKARLDRNLNWAEAKRRYPCLNPGGDIDADNIGNPMDPRPFMKDRPSLWW